MNNKYKILLVEDEQNISCLLYTSKMQNFIREISGTRHLEILGWKPKFDDLETIITTAWE